MIDIRAQCVGMYADMGGCVSDVHMWVLPFPLTFSTNQPLEKKLTSTRNSQIQRLATAVQRGKKTRTT